MGGGRKRKARGVFASRNKTVKRVKRNSDVLLKTIHTFVLLYKLLQETIPTCKI